MELRPLDVAGSGSMMSLLQSNGMKREDDDDDDDYDDGAFLSNTSSSASIMREEHLQVAEQDLEGHGWHRGARRGACCVRTGATHQSLEACAGIAYSFIQLWFLSLRLQLRNFRVVGSEARERECRAGR